MIYLIVALQLATLAAVIFAVRKAMWASRIAFENSQKLDGISLQTTQQMETREHLQFLLGLPQGALSATRGWAGSPDFLLVLVRHILKEKPRAVVECGSGVSTVVMAQALKQAGGGQLVSLDHSADYMEETRERLRLHGLEDIVTLVHAPLVPQELERGEWTWYDISSAPSMEWDMVVIDGPPGTTCRLARYPAGPKLISKLTPRGVVFLDDTRRQEDKRTSELLVEEFGLELTRLPTEKGTDVLRRQG